MRLLLSIDPTGLAVHGAGRGDEPTRFAADTEGQMQFGQWLVPNLAAIFYVSIDHPQIECHRESAPLLRSRERRIYLQSMCQRLAPQSGLIGLQIGGNRNAGEKHVLVTTLADDSMVKPWLEILQRRRALVAAVCFLPVIFGTLQGRAERSTQVVLMISAAPYGGFRLSLYGKSVLLLHRHINPADDLIGEIDKTLQYAEKNDLLNATAVKLLLMKADRYEVFDVTDQRISDPDRQSLAAFNFNEELSDRRVVQLVHSMRHAVCLREEFSSRRYHTRKIAQRLWLSTAVVAIFCSMTLAANAGLGGYYQKFADVADSHRRYIDGHVPADLELEPSVKTKIAIVEFVTAVQSDVSASVLHSIEWLSTILQQEANIQLQALQWIAANSDSEHHRLIVSARIDDRVTQLVDGVTVANQLLKTLRSSNAAQVVVSRAPFGLGIDVAESARVSANLSDREFRIELLFRALWDSDNAN